jgi:hypothetical protein
MADDFGFGGLFDDVKSVLNDTTGVVEEGQALYGSLTGGGSAPVQGPPSMEAATKAFPWVLVGLGVGALLLIWYMRKR